MLRQIALCAWIISWPLTTDNDIPVQVETQQLRKKLQMVSANIKSDDGVLRILVVGSNRVRLNRIFSSLVLLQANIKQALYIDGSLHIEYLPCVAKFSFFTNELKEKVRYLESVEYFPHDSTGTLAPTSSSLLPFFDQDKMNDDSRFPPIAGLAIGSGTEGLDDTARIEKWITIMLSGNKDPIYPKIKTIEPNPNYHSMSEELIAYKQLSPDEKDEVNRQQTMGPEKMVKFVIDFTIELIQEAYKPTPADVDENLVEPVPDVPSVIDPSNVRYFCRMCRTALFGENDLQYPPHEVSQHQFSRRKIHHGSTTVDSISDRCQSHFLQQNLFWMGDDIQNGVSEGKFNCPNCCTKIGTWIWSGTQCSCGTWVVPAIQVPKSKVDVVKPPTADPPITAVDTLQETNID